MGPINGALLALGARLTSIVDWRLTGKNSPEPIVRQQSMPHSKTLTGMTRIGARKKAGIAGKGRLLLFAWHAWAPGITRVTSVPA
jgi:hypothetical protein